MSKKASNHENKEMGLLGKKKTNHLINDLNGVTEVGSLKTSGDHGLEKLRVIYALVEVVAFDFDAPSFEAFGFFEDSGVNR